VSEFLGEARVVIRPDTTQFRAQLAAEVLSAARGVTVPVTVVPTVTGGAGALAAQAAGIDAVARANQEAAGATKAKSDADREAAKSASTHTKQLHQVRTAAFASAASMAGLRGAVLTAGGAFLGATVAIQAFGQAVSSAANLQTELAVFAVTAGATADEMERVREQAVLLGRDISLPGVAAGDAAEAMSLLARAGLDVENSIAGARGVLQLAAAAQIDNATATELAASALNAFQLAGEDAVHVADILAVSANESQGSITDMGIALRQTAAIADLVGLSLEETSGFLTLLARAGLRGSDAGTSFRVALQRLVAPTKAAQKQIEALNLNLRDVEGNLRPEVFFELGEALSAMSRAQQQATLVSIFGADASRAAALLARENVTALDELVLAYDKQGSAAELAGARAQGFAGQVEALKNNLETLGTELGTTVLPALGLIVENLNALVGTAQDAVGAFKLITEGAQDLAGSFFDLIPGGERVSGILGDIAKDTLGPAAGFTFAAKQVQRFTGVFSDSVGEISGDATAVENDVRDLFSVFSESGGLSSPTAVNEFVNSLDELADKLAEGDPAAQKLARRIRELIKELQNPAEFKVALDLDFDESDLRASGARAGDASAEGALLSLRAAGSAVGAVGLEWMDIFENAIVPAAADVGTKTGDAFVKNFNASQVTGQLQAQRTAVAQAKAFGETGLEELIAERERIDRILNSSRAPSGPALESLLNERASVINEIASIREQQATDAKNAAEDIKKAQDDADNALLDALSTRRDDADRRAAVAASTEGLQDDIAAQNRIQALITIQIGKVRAQIKNEQLRAQAIRELRIAKNAARREEAALREQQREAAAEQRATRILERGAALELDIELADINENDKRRVALRRRRIAQLKKEARLLKLEGNALKENRNERARIRKEIEDILKEDKQEKEEGRSAQQFFFENLQAQQGFASNLLGNLIPAGQTAGLVGMPSPGTGIKTAANVQEGKAGGGPTAGQASTTNELLLRIERQLKVLNGANAAPEATRQRATGSSVMDIQ
jgi:TP901 family phage tail tape measure protein